MGYAVKRNIEAKPFSMGFAVGAVGQLSINKWFSARLCIDYMRFGTDASKIVEDMDKAFRENGITPGTGDLKASMGGQSVFDFRLLGRGKYPTGTIVSPYVSFGPLFLSRSSNDIDLTLGADREKASIEGGFFVGITYGIGAEFAIGKSSTVFIEVNDLYTWPKSGAWGPSQVLVGFIYQ